MALSSETVSFIGAVVCCLAVADFVVQAKFLPPNALRHSPASQSLQPHAAKKALINHPLSSVDDDPCGVIPDPTKNAANGNTPGGPWHDPNFATGHDGLVHLFEWKWNDIAQECENFLGPHHVGGVQVSPPNECRLVTGPAPIFRPWWERYQPVSYEIESRSGNRQAFIDMVARCNKVGVRVYVDAVLNHMAADCCQGMANDTYDSGTETYPAVPYTMDNFTNRNECPTASGNIEDYNDAQQVRNCRLLGLPDLGVYKCGTADRMAAFLNDLIDIGVAGFRLDASKHMWPDHINKVLRRLNYLNTKFFPERLLPFIVQEVIDYGDDKNRCCKRDEYWQNGRTTEFRFGNQLSQTFWPPANRKLADLQNFGFSNFEDTFQALTFVDNHDTQRSTDNSVLTFRNGKYYIGAVSFLISWPYGLPRAMSSFFWEQQIVNGVDQNVWQGPPHNADGSIQSVPIFPNGTCGGGWICEHRRRSVANMFDWRSTVGLTSVFNWWSNGGNHIAFSRGYSNSAALGFVAFNNDDNQDMNETLYTGLPAGRYCDVISGWYTVQNGAPNCSGNVVTVDNTGKVAVGISRNQDERVFAIHVNARM